MKKNNFKNKGFVVSFILFSIFYFLFSSGVADAAFTISRPPYAFSLSSGLVGYWTFDGQHTNWATGQTFDQSGKGNHGTLSSMSTSTTPAPGKLGQALKFDGIINSVSVPSTPQLDITGPLTLSTWINVEQGGVNQVIVSKGPEFGAGVEIPYVLRTDSSNPPKIVFSRFNDSGAVCAFTSNSSISLNQWHHISVISDENSRSTLFINGISNGTCAGSGAPNASGVALDIGRDSDGFGFRGRIDDVRIYNRILSPQEIQQLYNLGQAKFANSPVTNLQSGLVGYYTFDGQHTNWATGRIFDQSGKGNHGTLTSMSTSTSPAPGKMGQALRFNGNNQYVQIPNSDSLNPNSLSLSLWFKVDDFGNNSYSLISKPLNGPPWSFPYLLSMIRVNSSSIEYDVGTGENGNYSAFAVSGLALQSNTWYHVGLSYDASIPVGPDEENPYTALFVFLNGRQIGGNNAINGNLGTSSIPFIIGGDYGASPIGNPHKGLIDEVRIYNRPLSKAEMRQLYLVGQATIGNSPVTSLQSGLVGYWTFDGQHTNWATGQTFDQSGKENHGTLTNMSTSTTPAPGKLGQGFQFDGVDDRINTGATDFPGGTVTLSFSGWIYASTLDFDGIFTTIIDDCNADCSAVGGFNVLLDDRGGVAQGTNGLRIGIDVTPDTECVAVANNVFGTSYEWRHVVFTYSAANGAAVYVDGQLRPLNSSSKCFIGSTFVPDANSNLFLGSTTGGTNFFKGKLDDVRIYSRELSKAEVDQLFRLGR